MKTLRCFQTFLLMICALLIGQAAAQEEKPASLDTAKIEQLTGVKGSFDPSKTVFKVMAPRADLKVTVAEVHMIPPMDCRIFDVDASTSRKLIETDDEYYSRPKALFGAWKWYMMIEGFRPSLPGEPATHWFIRSPAPFCQPGEDPYMGAAPRKHRLGPRGFRPASSTGLTLKPTGFWGPSALN